MDQTNTSLGNETGGNMSTGNPQDIGTQNISNTQTNIQTGSPNPFTNLSLRITDENGRPLETHTVKAAPVTQPVKPLKHNNPLPIMFTAGLLIVVICLVSWLMNHNSELRKY